MDEFDRLTEHVVEQVRADEPGTLVYIVHAVPTAPLQRILYEVYQDHQAYDEHRARPYIVEYEADRRRCVLATNVIELGLRQAKVSPFPSFSTISDLLSESGIDLTGVTRSARGRGRDRDPARQGRGGRSAADDRSPDGRYPDGPYQAGRYQDGPHRDGGYRRLSLTAPTRTAALTTALTLTALTRRSLPRGALPRRPLPDGPYQDGGWHDQPPAPGHYPPGDGAADEPGYHGWAELRREDSGYQ